MERKQAPAPTLTPTEPPYPDSNSYPDSIPTLTPEQLKENGKASKRAYYCNTLTQHEFLQPGGRYYDYLHRKATCEKCGNCALST